MFGYGGKKIVVEDKNKIKLTVVANVGDEKKEEQLLMGSTTKK